MQVHVLIAEEVLQRIILLGFPGGTLGAILRNNGFRLDEDLTAQVKVATKASVSVPKWMGGRMPLSTLLAQAVRQRLDEARQGIYADEEMRAVAPVLEQQKLSSRIPEPHELLIEQIRSREGYHAFIYTYAGRLANEGICALVSARIMRETPLSFSTMSNDYGFELFSNKKIHFTDEMWRQYLSPHRLVEDLFECMNTTELARRQFREIARIAGLVFPGYPGAGKTARQLQVSSGLLYDVFRQFDPENLLLSQARREVFERQLEVSRLKNALEEISRLRFIVMEPERLTPFAFPLWAERFRQTFTSEKWKDRLDAMIRSLEKDSPEDSGRVVTLLEGA